MRIIIVDPHFGHHAVIEYENHPFDTCHMPIFSVICMPVNSILIIAIRTFFVSVERINHKSNEFDMIKQSNMSVCVSMLN